MVTRNGENNEFIAYIVDEDGSLTLEFTYDDSDDNGNPIIVDNNIRFGFFHDDNASIGAEATTGGKVYSVKVWDDVLTPNEAVAAMGGCTDATACNYNEDATNDDGSCTYAAADHDCDGNCIAANVDWAGDQNNDGFLGDDGSNYYINMESYPNLGSASLNLNGTETSMDYADWGNNAHWYANLGNTFDASTTYDWSVTVSNSCGTSQTVSGSFSTDCASAVGGSAVADECGVCDGDNSSCADCAGVPNGDSWASDCGCVAADNDGNDCDDCDGTPNGSA